MVPDRFGHVTGGDGLPVGLSKYLVELAGSPRNSGSANSILLLVACPIECAICRKQSVVSALLDRPGGAQAGAHVFPLVKLTISASGIAVMTEGRSGRWLASVSEAEVLELRLCR